MKILEYDAQALKKTDIRYSLSLPSLSACSNSTPPMLIVRCVSGGYCSLSDRSSSFGDRSWAS